MPDRSVVTRFEAKIDGYLAGVTKMQGATEKFAKSAATSAAKHTADWDKIGRTATVGGLALGAVVVGAAKAYADFEQAMSSVAAVADASAKQQAALGEAAIKAGQDTVFSATEAAKAEGELARAGVSVSDILGGALRGSLDLAAAGQIDLAKAAEISAQAMNIFNLEGRDVGHIADVLTAGANKSAAGVDDLGMALQQGGLLAKQTGLTLEDTVGVLSAFADNALKGSDAGTSLKTMLQRLTPQSKEQAAAMEDLGLSFYDANGQFVGITEAAGRMQTAFRDLTPEQRNAAMATIFGSDAVRGANILMEQGEAGIRKYIDAVNDQGAAQRMAARQTDNLKGDIEQLKGTLESAFIRGGAGGNEGLRDLVQGITSLVDKFNELSPAAQANTVKAAAALAGLLLLGGGVIKVTTSVLGMSKALRNAGVDLTALKSKGAAAAPVLARVALSLAAVANADALFGNSKAVVNITRLTGALADGEQGLRGINRAFDETADFSGRADSGIRDVGDAFRASFDPSTTQKVDKFLGSIKGIFGGTDYSDISTARERLAELDQTLTKLVTSGHVEEAKAAFAEVSREAARQGVSVKQVEDTLPGYYEALDTVTASAKGAADATEDLTPATYDAAKAAQDAADGTKTWADELDAINSPILDAREAARQFEAAIDDGATALKEYKDAIVKKAIADGKSEASAKAMADQQVKSGKALDITTAAGRKNQEALDAVASSAIEQITAMQANGASQTALQSKLNTSKDRLYDVARSFGMSKAEAKKYVDQVLKVPASVSTTVTAKTEAAKRSLEDFQKRINALRGNTVTITTRYVDADTRTRGSRSTAGGITKAGGGYVSGPGSKTSDSIPAWLSNGEFVLKAAAVDHYGVGLLNAMNSLALADGGHVTKDALRFAGGGGVMSSVRELSPVMRPAAYGPVIVHAPTPGSPAAPVIQMDVRTEDPARAAALAASALRWELQR